MMKKLNDRAFTMIELIAAITIMALLMLIIIPNIFGIVEKNKKTTYLNDAKQLITMAKNQYEADPTITEPTDSLCLVFRLKDLRKSGLEKGPNGGKYNGTYSYVTINYESGKYIYGVQLLEEYSTRGKSNYRGIAYTKQADLQKSNIEKNTNSMENYTDLSSLSVSSSCPNGLVFSDGSIGNKDNLDSEIKEGDVLTVNYRIGSNVEEIGSEVATCTVPESKKYCIVTLPSIKAKDGYNSVGWSRSKGARSGDKQSIYLTKISSVYYANAIDDIAPAINLSKQEDQLYTKEKTIDVDLVDLGVGLDQDIVVKYGWSLSNNVEPENYIEVKPDYQKGSKKVTFQAEGNNLNGDYYLWVEPINLQDIEENENKKKIISEGVFKYNITRPSCRFTNINSTIVGDQETILLTCTDDETSVISQNLTIDDFSVSSDNGKIVSVSDAREVANGYEYQVTVEAVGTGGFSVVFSKDKIQNGAGNMNEETSSPEIVVNGKTYHVQYILGDNMSNIDDGEENCTTTGKSLECEIMLPTIKANDGYTADGWYYNNTKIGENGQYIISGDIQLNAKVKPRVYTVIYDYETNGGTSVAITPNSGITEIKELERIGEFAYTGDQIIKKEEKRIEAIKNDWEFVGWNTDPDEVIALDEYYITNKLSQDEDLITLYAIFRRRKTAKVYYYNPEERDSFEEVSCYIYNNAPDEDICNFTIPDKVEKSAPEGFNYVGLLSNCLEDWTIDSQMTDQPEDRIEYTSENPVYYAVYHNSYVVNYIKEDTIDNIIDTIQDEGDEEPDTGEDSGTDEKDDTNKGPETSEESDINGGSGTGEVPDISGGTDTNTDEGVDTDGDNEDTKNNIIQILFDAYLYHRTGYDTSYNIKLPKITPRRGYTNTKWTEILDSEGTKGNIFAPEQVYTLTSSTTTFSASAEDIEKPTWSIVSAEKDCNDLKITIQGSDTSGQAISSLKLDKLSIKIGGKENSQGLNTTLSEIPSESSEFIGGTVQHVLTIKNYNQQGEINITISESTLRDGAGNTNVTTSLIYPETGIYDVCEPDEPTWTIIRVEEDCDSLRIILQGTSPSGKVESNLKLENLVIKLGNENISESTTVEKVLSKVSSESSEFIQGSVQYILTLKGYNQIGDVKINIPAATLEDEAGNMNQAVLSSYPKEEIYHICQSTTS